MQIAFLERVAVLGAGTMGHGIAHVFAAAGYDVALYDVAEDALVRARERIGDNLQQGVARGKLASDDVSRIQGRLSTTTDLAAAVAHAGLIVEAVPEREALKHSLFAELGRGTGDEVVLATNTSSFSISALGAVSGCPQRVVGLHFFNPVHIMRLLEVVVGAETAPTVVAFAHDVARVLGKTAITVQDAPGFATTRLGLALGLEAIRMLEQGVASAEDIDTAMELGYRHPMGPLRLGDLVGLDVRLDIARHLFEALGSEAFRPPALLEQMVREGRLGKKTGRGFYEYPDEPA